MDGGVIAIIFFALVIGIILVIVLVSIKKRKQYKELLPAAIEWVDEAKGKGYDYNKIKAELKAKGWSGKIIRKAMKINGITK